MQLGQVGCDRALGHLGKDQETERFGRIGWEWEVRSERDEEVFKERGNAGEDAELQDGGRFSLIV